MKIIVAVLLVAVAYIYYTYKRWEDTYIQSQKERY